VHCWPVLTEADINCVDMPFRMTWRRIEPVPCVAPVLILFQRLPPRASRLRSDELRLLPSRLPSDNVSLPSKEPWKSKIFFNRWVCVSVGLWKQCCQRESLFCLDTKTQISSRVSYNYANLRHLSQYCAYPTNGFLGNCYQCQKLSHKYFVYTGLSC